MFIESIELNNFCCFETAKIACCFSGKRSSSKEPRLPNVNLILGDNGSGKSAVLRGLALAVLGSVLQSGGYRPYMLVRRKGQVFDQSDPEQGANASVLAKIRLHQQDAQISNVPKTMWEDQSSKTITGQTVIKRQYTTEEIVLTAHANPSRWVPLKNDFSPAFFMVGYGGFRRTGPVESYDPNTQERSRSRRYQRVAGIFELSSTLVSIQTWWNAMRDKERTDSARTALSSLAPPGSDISIRDDDSNGVVLTVYRTPLPFEALSDGYRTLIGLVADLLYHLAQVAPKDVKLTDLYGVVLIDELDLFLHPVWQRIIIDRLTETFPNLQFFITTHSPILAGTLQPANIIISERDNQTGATSLEHISEHVLGLSADQVLGSPYFGLGTSRAPVAENRLRMLAQLSSNGDENAAIDYMRLLAEGLDGKDLVEATAH